MLELMSRCGMRIGEVLKIRPVGIQDRKITFPKQLNRVFELFSGLKFHIIAGFNFDCFPGLWITAFSGFTTRFFKRAETN